MSRKERILLKRYNAWVKEFLTNNKVSGKEFLAKARIKFKELEKEIQDE